MERRVSREMSRGREVGVVVGPNGNDVLPRGEDVVEVWTRWEVADWRVLCSIAE